MPEAMPSVIESKNRKATDLRQKARALEAEAMTDEKLTTEQIKAKFAEAKDLNERAQMFADFTPTAEIDRQGGTGDLVREIPADEMKLPIKNKR